MGAKLWLVYYVICQTIITELRGLALPLSETIGKVTPIPPKPLSSFSPEASSITKSPLIWEGEDIMPKLVSPAAPGLVFRQFSSPITFTSSSRPLPVPRIDKSSIKDVKMPERLGKRFLQSEDRSTNITPYSLNPKTSLPHKQPTMSSTTKLPSSTSYSSADMCPAVPNKLSSVPNIQSSEPFKPNFIPNIIVPPISKSITTLDLATANTFPLHPGTSLPNPFHYRSMHLPGVRTPEPFSYCGERISYTETLNFNVQNPINTFNSVSEINKLPVPLNLNPNKVSDIPKPRNISPKILCNDSSPSGIFVQNPEMKTRTKSGIESNTASVYFKPSLTESSNQITSTVVDKISDTTNKQFLLPRTNQEGKSLFPSQPIRAQSTPLEFDVLRNCTKSFENLKSFSRNTPYIYPATDAWPNTRESLNPHHVNRYYGEDIINPYVLIPEITPSGDYVSNSFLFPPPTIPVKTTPLTLYPISSPIPFIPSVPHPPIAQSICNIPPTFSEMVSNFAEQLLRSCKSYLNSITQNVKSVIHPNFNPYAYSGIEPQSLPRVKPLQTNSILPNLYSPIYSSNTPAVDFSTFTSFNSPTLQMAASDLSPVSSSKTSAVTMLPLFKDLSSPSLNPSYLPSPALPPSSFYKEIPVYKSGSPKRDSDEERLLETMVIAEILNNDDSFDWEDLDAFLTLLSLS